MDCHLLVSRAADAYGKCRSYADKGQLLESDARDGRPLSFQTHFLRPRNFRFDWWSHPPYYREPEDLMRNTVWSNSTQTVSCISFRDEPDFGHDLRQAIAGAAGVSGLTIFMISRLLMPDLYPPCKSILDLEDVSLLADEVVGEKECYHLLGSQSAADDLEVWIDKEDLSICRVREKRVTCFGQSPENQHKRKRQIEELKRLGVCPKIQPG
jgi:hypothetical protein